MENRSNISWLRIMIAALLALLLVLLCVSVRSENALASARMRIEAVYQKAFYETVQLTQAVSSDYQKLAVAGDEARALSLLGEISRQSQSAASNLALLPLGEETVSATLKFINQAEDFAESLSDRIADGGKISQTDYESIARLSEGAEQFHRALLALLDRYEAGEALFSIAGAPEETGNLYPISNSAEAYPRLLYDGPYSDAESFGDFEYVKSLAEVSVAQAQAALEEFLPSAQASYTGEDHPEIPCYEFSVVSAGRVLSASVTKNGGRLLCLLPESSAASTQTALPEDELLSIAAAFLGEHGFGDMKSSYYSAFDGVLTVNFAPVRNGAVIYPELVKLQLSMADGAVIGMDAEGYLRNHRTRALGEIQISSEAAMARVSPKLSAESAQLCVIPKDGKEYTAWEIRARDAESSYLVYIDVENGVERDLLQLVPAQQGTLVM